MAIGDIGMFLPRESHYQTPGAFNKMLQAEAMKRANYLAAMDQFYENLTESQRQFNQQLAFNVETRDLNLAWEREKMQEELAFRREELEAEEEYREGLLGLEERRVELAEAEGAGEEDSPSAQSTAETNPYELIARAEAGEVPCPQCDQPLSVEQFQIGGDHAVVDLPLDERARAPRQAGCDEAVDPRAPLAGTDDENLLRVDRQQVLVLGAALA